MEMTGYALRGRDIVDEKQRFPNRSLLARPNSRREDSGRITAF